MCAFRCSLLGLLACVLLTSASQIDIADDNYIIGGRAAVPGQFPSIVSLRTITNQHLCAGVIISDRWVASSGSCLFLLRSMRFYIAVGSYRPNDGTRIRPSRIVFHPHFERRRFSFDIAIAQTQQKIVFNNRVQPIRWPTSTSVPNSQSVRVIGWGMDHVS